MNHSQNDLKSDNKSEKITKPFTVIKRVCNCTKDMFD